MIRVYVWCMHPITPFQYLKPYQLCNQPADTLRQPSSQFQQSRRTTLSSFPGKPWLMSINPISLGSSLILVQHLLGFSPCEVPHASVSDAMCVRERERKGEAVWAGEETLTEMPTGLSGISQPSVGGSPKGRGKGCTWP